MSSESVMTALSLLEQRFPDKIYRPDSEEYGKDVSHFLGTAALPSAFSIRPSSIEDVTEILKIIGRDDIRCPFAVKSGGHAGYSGFSSTTGVQISMANFKEITYDKNSQTVRLGGGLLWEEVYAELDKHNVTVVGGRIAGVGTGLLLGGGFSWITEEYGLSIDTIVAYDLVLPDGSYVEVTEESEPDLFFALKGGLNNFGIVTTFTLKAFPIGKVWAGIITYSLDYNEQIEQAVSNFSAGNTNVKAQIIATYTLVGPKPIWQLMLFHNGPSEPKVFQPFLEIPSLSKDVGPRSLADFVEMTRLPPSQGGTVHTVPIRQYTLPIIKQIQESCNKLSSNASRDGRSLTATIFMVEPFTSAFNHSTPSAYPHSPDRMLTPSLLFVTYANSNDAAYFDTALREAIRAIKQVAITEDQSKPDDTCYANYALADTPLELLFGENLPRLREIRAKIDPKNIMGLTGGFKL